MVPKKRSYWWPDISGLSTLWKFLDISILSDEIHWNIYSGVALYIKLIYTCLYRVSVHSD